MKALRFVLPVALAMIAAPAYAHFLWINTVRDTSGEVTVQLCFAEDGEPGEAHLVPRLEKVPLMANKAGEKPTEVKTEAVVGEKTGYRGAKGTADTVYTTGHELGLITRGENTYLLYYTAKHIDLSKPEALKGVARAEHLKLDLVPTLDKDTMEVTVLFDGKPVAAGSQVLVETPNVGRDEHTTDANGKVSFKLTEKGHYELRARYKNEVAGEKDGKKYPYEMYYGTLVLDVPAAK